MEKEFTDWYEANENRFHSAQFDEKQIAYSAWLEGRNAVMLFEFKCGSLSPDKVDELLKMQIEECRYFTQRCARDKGMASSEYDKWISETPVLTIHKKNHLN